MHVMGEDCSERLDVTPAQFKVIVTRRPKYACRACEGAVVQAAAPARLIEAGIPSFCWTHLRRRFYEIAAGGNAPLADAAEPGAIVDRRGRSYRLPHHRFCARADDPC